MEIFLGAFTDDWEQRRAAYLHERLIGKSPADDDEERRRRGATTAGASASRARATRIAGRASFRGDASVARPMANRFAGLASGSQPAVVKMASFGGGGRLGAMAAYISRNGEVAMENQAGEGLRGREAIAELSGDWAHLMGNRAESRDIGTFHIDVTGEPAEGVALNAWARDVAKSAFGDRSFVFAVEEREGHRRIEGVVVLRDRSGERLTADEKAEEIVRSRMSGEGTGRADAEFHFSGYGNGVEYGTARVRKLVERHQGSVETDRGETVADTKSAGDLVQLQWRGELHSRKPRDVMHLVMSARAGTDAEAFRAAARDFLASEFAHHRYVFSIHDPTQDPKGEREGGKRPHVHVHAIVAMRSEDGERVETSIAAFRRWREGLAESARTHGIRMEMTDRRDQANAPAFTRNQVRPVSRDGRTEHEGTSPSAQERYGRKRRETPTVSHTSRSKNYAETVRTEWSNLEQLSVNNVRDFARANVYRLETAANHQASDFAHPRKAADSHSQFRTELVKLSALTEVDTMSAMTRSEFEAYEKRVETALFRAERIMPEEQRENFEEIAAAAREHVGVRREIMEQAELASDRDETDPNRQWDEAVARHGLRVVEAANEIMIEIEYYRERIEQADDEESRADNVSLRASLNLELARAGELGAAGNAYVREIAEVDEELRIAVDAAERSRDRSKSKFDGAGDRSSPPQSFDDGRPTRQIEDGQNIEKAGVREAGDTTRSDPAKQHVPRLEQLEREAERDRDEHER